MQETVDPSSLYCISLKREHQSGAAHFNRSLLSFSPAAMRPLSHLQLVARAEPPTVSNLMCIGVCVGGRQNASESTQQMDLSGEKLEHNN